jgi:hypothetical protein
MKIFLSWSGDRSKLIAEALRKWIPKVIQAIDPWMSKEDIASGSRWSIEIFKELEETKVGIICITPENQHNPWIQFESGALSKSIEQTFVIPYLFDMIPSDLSGPLVQFQAVLSNKEGTLKLLLALNKALESRGLLETELEEVFDVWWHKLEENLEKMPVFDGEKTDSRTEKEILNEILNNSREQLRKEDIRLTSILEKEDDMITVFKDLQSQLKTTNQGGDMINLMKQNGKIPDGKDIVHLNKLMASAMNFDSPLSKLNEIMEKGQLTTKKLLDKDDNKVD